MDLNQFAKWQAEKPKTRRLEIEANFRNGLTVWVYDTGIGEGQYVKSVEEIDLEAKKAAAEKSNYERLKKKFEEAEE